MKFPPILVINLDSRPDRWALYQKEFAGWNYERVPGIKHEIGWKGCTLSHIKCLEIARERDYDWVLVLEDDCVLRPNAKNTLNTVLPTLWNTRHKWDIFAGGIAIKNSCNPIIISKTPPLFHVSGNGSHFSLLHRDSIVNVLNRIEKDVDNMVVQDDHCIDTWYANNIREWTTAPYISIQRPGRSDLLNKYKDSQKLYLDSETTVFKLLLQPPPFIWSNRS